MLGPEEGGGGAPATVGRGAGGALVGVGVAVGVVTPEVEGRVAVVVRWSCARVGLEVA